MNYRHIKHPFKAVLDENSKILILGSVPSVKSVEYNFFYMHPQNHFWKVLGYIFDIDFYNMSIQKRKENLIRLGVALYDSVEECDIYGSSDSKIKNVVPADIQKFLNTSKIIHIFCNGNASYKYFSKAYPQLIDITTILPSTSPANASWSLERLSLKWNEEIRKYL